MATVPKYRVAQTKLRAYIADHSLVAGDQLPPETELATTFGMSRLSLREAVKGLETVGVLKTLQGGGTYVQQFSFSPILENLPYAFQLETRDLRNLLELRASLEEGLVFRASEWVRRRDLDDLRAIAKAMRDTAPDSDEMAELDRAFHRRLYEPLDNPLVTQMIDLFWEMFHRMHAASTTPPPPSQALAQLHLDIVDALANERGVVESMTNHFEDIRRRLDDHATPEAPATN
jgi:DNA-binding FadR family transcriptional regulator